MSSVTIKTGTGVEYKSSSYISSDEDMGNSSISLDLSIDAQVDPGFSADWSIDYNGETFKLSTINPVAIKDTNSIRYKYSLVFNSERSDLARFIMQDLVSSGGDSQIPQKQIFSFYATLSGFADRFNSNLLYWFSNQRWEMRINPEYDQDESSILVSCSNISLWALLQTVWDLYGVRWYIAEDSGVMVIFVAYDAIEVEHIFEYGMADNGEKGLVKIERSPSNTDVLTVLQGAGSGTNMPYNYFKEAGSDFTIPDPDTNEALAFINFLGIMPISYRHYMQGWNDSQQGTHESGQTDAYEKGYDDYASGVTINPITYVKSDNTSKYGERWGGLEQSSEIFPTLIGAERAGVGRVDEIIDVEEILNDDYTSNDNTGRISAGETDAEPLSSTMLAIPGRTTTATRAGLRAFVIEKDINEVVVSLNCASRLADDPSSLSFTYGEPNGANLEVFMSILDSNKETLAIKSYENEAEKTLTFKDIPSGNVYLECRVKATNTTSPAVNVFTEFATSSIRVYNYDLPEESETFEQTFDVWIKDIWNTAQGAEESDSDYTDRVWTPLISTDDMTILFDSGLLVGEDYEFKIAVINGVLQVFPDRTKSLNGVSSEWRVSLIKSDAELETVNLYLPNKTQNAIAGDFMHFINIEMPYDPYVYAAEQRVEDWITEELAKVDDEFATFSIQASRIFINNNFTEKSKLNAGSKIRLRDTRLIGESYIVLHVNSVVKTFTEDSVNPEWGITATDSVSINQDPISLIQGEVETLSTGTSSSQQQTDELIKAMSRIFLRKDGLSDTSYSETEFKEDLKLCRSMFSDDFQKGDIGGNGFGLYRDSVGNSILEADKVVVRKEMVVNQLIVNQVTHYGGKRMYSAAGMVCTAVEEVDNGFYIPSYDEMREMIMELEEGGNFYEGSYFITSSEYSATEMKEVYIDEYFLPELYVERKEFNGDYARVAARADYEDGDIVGDLKEYKGENWWIWKIEDSVTYLCREYDEIYQYAWSSGSALTSLVGADDNDGLINSRLVYNYSSDSKGEAMGLVADQSLGYKCSFDTKGGSVLNLFAMDDLGYCQRYSPVDNALIKYYWRKVIEIGDDYIVLSKSDKDPAGTGVPSENDNIAQVGNKTNTDRQNVMIVDQIGDPSTVQYSGINNYSFGNKNYIGYGVDTSSGEAFLYAYGRSYIGSRDESQYVKYEDDGSGQYKLTVKGDVEIVGGLLVGVMMVQNDEGSVAGLSGNSEDPMIFAGAADYSNIATAKFRVYDNGKVVAEDADIEGTIVTAQITATGGTIAGFTLSGDGMVNSDFDGDGAYVIMRYDPDGIFVGIGVNVLPSTYGVRGCGRFENHTPDNPLFPTKNLGIYTSVKNSSHSNLAHFGDGNVVFNGLMQGYNRSEQVFSADNQSLVLNYISNKISINFNHSSCNFILPSRFELRNQLGISSTTPFTVSLSLFCKKGSSGGDIYGRTTEITGANVSDYPYMLDNNATSQNGGEAMGQGDVYNYILDFDGTNYYAYRNGYER